MKILAGCIGVLVAGLALASDTNPLLAQLSADLAKARELPVGAKTPYRCPAKLDQLRGVDFATVLATLPKPDDENSSSVSYFLTSPVSTGQRGGGFPEITFTRSKTGTVGQITCVYSK
ncbi:hypothetical protein [Ideonella sp.]|uniref:hypothetical protein n=1 Tax=Ideonella sp. TaxID=1929293 RepID=UPI003BB77312